jgi:ribonuclease HI
MQKASVFGVFSNKGECLAICKKRKVAEAIAEEGDAVRPFKSLSRAVGAVAPVGPVAGEVEDALVARVKGAGAYMAEWQARAEQGILVIHCDGACRGNGTPHARAGIGVFVHPGSPHNVSEPLPGDLQSNQRAELAALTRALRIAALGPEACQGKPEACFEVHSDSSYAINSATVWGDKWERNNFRTAAGQPVLNQDLVRPLREAWRAAGPFLARIVKVPGHMGNVGNECADALAVGGVAREHPLDL